MLNIFKSKAQRNIDTIIATVNPASTYAGALMCVAKNPQAVNNKAFLKDFKQAQTNWFNYYTEKYEQYTGGPAAGVKLDLSNHNEQLVCSAMAVIIASVFEGNYTLEEAQQQNGMLNIIKKEANLNNVPRVYVDAYIKFYETAAA